jgi:hypothetical protein
LKHSLEGDHGDVDRRDVVDGVGDEARLIVQGLCVAHVVAHPDAPGQEQHLACRSKSELFKTLSLSGLAKLLHRGGSCTVNYLSKDVLLC